MFVVSFRNNKKKAAAVLAAVLVAAAAAVAVTRVRATAPTADCAGKKYSLTAQTNEQRVAFFRQFGWEVKPGPVSEQEIEIPQTFGDVYANYNNIQQEQGLDLAPYQGKICRQYVYEVTNYPQESAMKGTLLVYDGNVVGGDLSTPALDGFMTGFDGQIDSDDYTVGQPTLARETDGTLVLDSSAAPSSPTKEAEKAPSSHIPANAWPTD